MTEKTHTHPNSKKVTIFRAGSFITNAQTNAQEFMSLSKKSIGSYYAGGGSKAIGSGLDFEEQDLLMPLVLDIPKEDRGFRQAIRTYFTEMLTKVPAEGGVELEIGLKKDNNKPLAADNLPINITDYIRYRHAIKHPRVAMSLDAAKGQQTIEFYVFDKEAALNANVKTSEAKDEALTLYMQIKDDEDKVNMLLTLLKQNPIDFRGKNAFGLKKEKLRELADKQAEEFVKTVRVDNFEQRYRVQAMLNTGIILKIGNTYIDAETRDTIGHSIDEVVFFLKDPSKSSQVSIMKTRLQESLRGTTSKAKAMPAAEKASVPDDDENNS